MSLSGNVRDHFLQVLEKIRNGEHFGIIRPSDGEYIVMTNRTLTNIDNWTFNSGDMLRDELIVAIQKQIPNLYIGIQCNSCPYCNKHIHDDMMNKLRMDHPQTTYATIFCNGNWRDFIGFLKTYERGIYAVTPGTLETTEIRVNGRYVIDKYLVNNWNTMREQETANVLNFVKNLKNELICFSAGPLSKIWIPLCMELNPNNIYLDVGSALDVILKGQKYARSYVNVHCGYNKSFCNHIMNTTDFLRVYQFDDKKRYGVNADGGYVVANLPNESYDCYISAGISNEESFSRDFIRDYGLNETNSFGFDGTVNDYPWEYTKQISFIKKNIGPIDDDNNTNLDYLMDRFDNIFLKMDIEGGEYPWLFHMDESRLAKCKQIVLEFHGITNDGWGCSYQDKAKCLEKLSKTHYIVHAHGNNHGPTHNGVPDVIELTYVNKNYFAEAPALNTTAMPIKGLDFPNKKGHSDIALNFPPFYHG